MKHKFLTFIGIGLLAIHGAPLVVAQEATLSNSLSQTPIIQTSIGSPFHIKGNFKQSIIEKLASFAITKGQQSKINVTSDVTSDFSINNNAQSISIQSNDSNLLSTINKTLEDPKVKEDMQSYILQSNSSLKSLFNSLQEAQQKQTEEELITPEQKQDLFNNILKDKKINLNAFPEALYAKLY